MSGIFDKQYMLRGTHMRSIDLDNCHFALWNTVEALCWVNTSSEYTIYYGPLPICLTSLSLSTRWSLLNAVLFGCLIAVEGSCETSTCVSANSHDSSGQYTGRIMALGNRWFVVLIHYAKHPAGVPTSEIMRPSHPAIDHQKFYLCYSYNAWKDSTSDSDATSTAAGSAITRKSNPCCLRWALIVSSRWPSRVIPSYRIQRRHMRYWNVLNIPGTPARSLAIKFVLKWHIHTCSNLIPSLLSRQPKNDSTAFPGASHRLSRKWKPRRAKTYTHRRPYNTVRAIFKIQRY